VAATWVAAAIRSASRLAILVSLIAATPSRNTAETEVVIIGTVHSPMAHFDSDSLVGILDRVHPTVILFEVDSSFVDESSRLKSSYRAMNLEAVAVTRFQDARGTPLVPYDIEGRNAFYERTRYFDRQMELSRALGGLVHEGRLSVESRALFDSITAFDHIRDTLSNERPEVINSAVCDSAMARKQWFGMNGMTRIVRSTPDLRSFEAFADLREDEWNRRHRAMIDHISAYARAHRDQRIVVVCGFEHRYALRQGLAAEPAVRLREYWSD
jgi:hypothetical protein